MTTEMVLMLGKDFLTGMFMGYCKEFYGIDIDSSKVAYTKIKGFEKVEIIHDGNFFAGHYSESGERFLIFDGPERPLNPHF